MATFLKYATTTTVQLGPFMDEDDGKTPETSLSIVQGDVWLSKAGGAFGTANHSGTAQHNRVGWYRKTLNTTDTGTVGPLIVSVHEAGTALPVWREFMVLPANVYDSLVGGTGTDYLQTDATQVAGVAAVTSIRNTIIADGDATEINAAALNTMTGLTNMSALNISAAGRVEADVLLIEGADPTDTIRDSVVDDATRIDASALNTLSGYAPASTIAAATDVPSVNDLLTTTLADAASGSFSVPTVQQALYETAMLLQEKSVSGTTVTIKKVGGATLMTFTLDNATDPTSITRAS